MEKMTLAFRVENDFVIKEGQNRITGPTTITFKNSPGEEPYISHDYDWYITVALEKADKLTADRHLLTKEVLMAYRWAIREGFNHQLDPNLKNRYDYPRNQNTIKGILGYIDRIKKASDDEMKEIVNELS